MEKTLEDREYITLPRDIIQVLSEIGNDNDLASLSRLICNYSLHGEINDEQEYSPIVHSFWLLIKPRLDFGIKQFLNGSKGGAPKRSRPKSEEEFSKEQGKSSTISIEDIRDLWKKCSGHTFIIGCNSDSDRRRIDRIKYAITSISQKYDTQDINHIINVLEQVFKNAQRDNRHKSNFDYVLNNWQTYLK